MAKLVESSEQGMHSSEENSATESGQHLATDTDTSAVAATAATKDFSDSASSIDTGRSKSSNETEESSLNGAEGEFVDVVPVEMKSAVEEQDGEVQLVDIIAVQSCVSKGIVRMKTGKNLIHSSSVCAVADPSSGACAVASYSSGVGPSPVVQQLSDSSSEAVNCAASAAKVAREAALKCRTVMTETLDAGTIGKNRIDHALLRAEFSGDIQDVNHYTNVAAQYQDTIEAASRLAHEVEVSAESAEAAATAAEFAAKAAGYKDIPIYEQSSAEARNTMAYAYWAANTASVAAVSALKMEYTALKGMKKCWQRIDDAENTGTSNAIRRRQLFVYTDDKCSPRQQSLWVSVIMYLSLIFGTASIVFGTLQDPLMDLFYIFIITGVLLEGCFVIMVAYKIIRYFYKKRTLLQKNETRAVIASIENRLQELKTHFENNGISPVPSETPSDEGD